MKLQCGANHAVPVFVVVLFELIKDVPEGGANFFFLQNEVTRIILQLTGSSDIFKTALILVKSADSTQVKQFME